MSPDRPTGNKKKQIQKRGRAKLPILIAREGNKCHWCKRHIVKVGTIPESKIVQAGKDWVKWRNDEGEIVRSFWATTDHLVPVRDNGSNKISNLVAACGPCNRRRGAIDNPYKEPPKWQNNPVCKCGGPKPAADRKCRSCAEVDHKMAAICKVYVIDNKPGNCKKCSSALVELEVVEPVGMVYRCPTCVKSSKDGG